MLSVMLVMCMFKIIILLFLDFTGFYSVNSYSLLPEVLSNHIEKIIMSSSSNADYKLWVKYLERRLQIMFTTKNLCEFHKRNFKVKLFKHMDTVINSKCSNKYEGIQLGIFGRICGSSRNGKQVLGQDTCQYIKHITNRMMCYWDRSKWLIYT